MSTAANDFDGWVVDSLGRCVVVPTLFWLEVLNTGRAEDDKFIPVRLIDQSDEGAINSVLIHRPSGGLGDMICILPAVEDYIASHSGYNITIAIPSLYIWLFRHLESNSVHLVDYKTFHSRGFNKVRKGYATQYYIWCPAGLHEGQTRYRPTEGRIRNFAGQFGVSPRSPRIYLP